MTTASATLTVNSPAPDQANRPRMRFLGRAASALVAALGLTGLLGWVLDIPAAREILPQGVAMKGNTAVGLLLCALALHLLWPEDKSRGRRRCGRVLAVLVLVLGGATFCEHLFGWDLGIDQLLFREPPGQPGTMSPGRMGPPASLCFMLAGLAFFLLDASPRKARLVGQVLATAIGLIALLSLLGYAYGVEALYDMPQYTGIAFHTSLALLVLAAGLFSARPDLGLAALLFGDGIGSVLTRRLLFPALILPFVLGWSHVEGDRADLFDADFGTSVLVLATTVISALLILRSAAVLNRIDRKRRQSEDAREASRERLELLMRTSTEVVGEKDLEGLLQRVVDAARTLTTARLGVSVHGYVDGRFTVGTTSWSDDVPSCPMDRTFQVGRGGVYMDLISKAEPLRLTDAQLRSHPAWWGLPQDHPELRGLLGVRLVDAQGRPSGLIMVSDKHHGEFTEEDEHLLRQLSSITSLALQHIEARTDAEKRAEEAAAGRREVEKAKAVAEEASEAKSRFLANVSHELRTPLNAILGMTELALAEALPEAARECLETARDCADSLVAIVNEILDLSRIEAGRLVLDAVPFSLSRVVNETIKALGIRADEKGLRLNCDLPAGVPDRLVGDPIRLRQVLVNLVGNAIKFTKQGVVAVRVQSLASNEQEACLRFDVSDTGIGIAPEDRERIFAPFAQADAAMTRNYGGTGLGLAIASNLVAMMGGRIWVESQSGQGSVFSFTTRFGRDAASSVSVLALPASQAGQGREPNAAPPLRPLHILLAEDTPANQKLVSRILGKRGHKVDVATNGQEAVIRLRENDFDLVLMDVQMPLMDGLEATSLIRAQEKPTRKRLPIIAMTAHAMKGDQERCLEAGMDAYLAKPIDSRALIETIERLAR